MDKGKDEFGDMGSFFYLMRRGSTLKTIDEQIKDVDNAICSNIDALEVLSIEMVYQNILGIFVI